MFYTSKRQLNHFTTETVAVTIDDNFFVFEVGHV